MVTFYSKIWSHWSKYFQKHYQNVAMGILAKKFCCSKWPKNPHNIWTTGKFVAQNFQKLPNLVTQDLSPRHAIRDIFQ